MEATLTRRRHTREFDGNIGGTETTIPFFHFFFFVSFSFSFPFSFLFGPREIDELLLFILLAADDI